MNLPTVRFIDGEPPPVERVRGPTAVHSGYVIGLLAHNPGTWAVVEGEFNAGPAAHKLREFGKNHGVSVEAVARDGVVYARYVGEAS